MASLVNFTQYFLAGVAEAFTARIAPLSSFTNATNLEGVNLNDYVQIPKVYAAASASNDFAHATGYATPNSQIETVSVQLNKWKTQEAALTDAMVARLSPAALVAQGRALGNKLGLDVVTDILSSTASFTNYTIASGSQWASNTAIVGLGEDCDDNNWPDMARNLLVSPALYWKMVSNTTTLIASSFGNPDVIQNGKLSNYYGFDIFNVKSLPSTVKGLAISPSALAVALSTPTPQAGHNLEEVIRLTAPDKTDLPIQYIKFYDPYKRRMIHAFETLYGYTTLDATAGFNLLVTNLNV